MGCGRGLAIAFLLLSSALVDTAMVTPDLRAPLKCVVFDFDSTLSRPQFLERFGKWAIADKADVFLSMTEQGLFGA